MENLKIKLARFMQGRYGGDHLYMASLVSYFIVLTFNFYMRSTLISSLLFLLVVWTMFRALSRNIYQRRRENEKFLKVWLPVKAKLTLTIRKLKDIRTHRYRKCPNCSVVLRLPLKRGENSTKCPRCQTKFKVRIRL